MYIAALVFEFYKSILTIKIYCGVGHMQTADWQIIYRVTYANIYYIYLHLYLYLYLYLYTYIPISIPIPIRSASLANRSSSLANPSASLQVCSLHLLHTAYIVHFMKCKLPIKQIKMKEVLGGGGGA